MHLKNRGIGDDKIYLNHHCSVFPFTVGVQVRVVPTVLTREFTKPRRQRQVQRHQTKDSVTKTMAVHVRYNSSHISLPFSASQQREMTKSCMVWRT